MKPTVNQAGSAIILADLDEILFENLEHRYGAYVLRRDGNRYLIAALGLCLFLVITGVTLPQVFARMRDAGEMKREVNIITLDLPPIKQEEKKEVPLPPEPERPKMASMKKTIAVLILNPRPLEDIVKEPDVVEMDSLNHTKAAIGTVNRDGADPDGTFNMEPGDGDVPDVLVEEPKTDNDPPIDVVIFGAEEPRAINMNDIRNLVGYPQIARDAGIEGMVVLRVLIDERGNYVRHKVIKQAHPILAEACEQKVNRLKFTPAIQGNRPIKFWVNVPFSFKLMH